MLFYLTIVCSFALEIVCVKIINITSPTTFGYKNFLAFKNHFLDFLERGDIFMMASQ